jgi:hypothetical protein
MALGRIVKIVDENTIVINVGSSSEVTTGMVFVVIQESSEIMDPETDESLGRWEMVKAHLVAAHVQEKMTTLVPISDGVSSDSSAVLSDLMSRDSRGEPIGGRRVALPVDRSQVSGRPSSDVIRVGDIVRSVDE